MSNAAGDIAIGARFADGYLLQGMPDASLKIRARSKNNGGIFRDGRPRKV